MTPGVKDVARHAGVSVGTVSNVLNRPNLVEEPTRRKSLDSIPALGFVRNGFVRNDAARHLRDGSGRTPAHVLLDPSSRLVQRLGRRRRGR